MQTLDTTRLDAGQMRLLEMILTAIDKGLPPSAIGKRMRLSNLKKK